MSKIRRIDFSPDEFLAGTTDLTLEETGGYWKACSLMYSRGGPIADDEAWLARALGCHVRTWRKIRGRLLELGKLRLVDGLLTNGRAEREIGRAADRITKAHEAAEKSAQARRDSAEGRARDDRGEGEERAREGRGEAEKQDDWLDYNGLGRAGATTPSSSQPSTINDQSKKEHPPTEGGAPAPPDTASIVFGQGREWLVRQSGKSDRECRSMLGRWRGQHGDAALIEALGAAQRQGAIEPIGFITKALQERMNGRQGRGANPRDAASGAPTISDGVAAAFARRFPEAGG